jgi:hypothetical protein
MILTPEQWRAAGEEAKRREHPSGWSYRTDVQNLIDTLEDYHSKLQALREAIATLKSV